MAIEVEFDSPATRAQLIEDMNAAHKAKLEALKDKHAAILEEAMHAPVPTAQAIEAMWHKWSWRIHNALRVYCAWVDWHALPDGERTHLKLYQMLWGAEHDLSIRGQ